MKKRIVCFHLFNDYSGSPKVLSLLLRGLLEKGYEVDLVTSRGGVLDELKGCGDIRFSTYSYRFSNNALITLLRYGAAQLYTALLALRYLFRRDVVFYINTILPLGPALMGRLMGKRVVYHYHENAFVKGAFYRALAWCMQKLASEIICVSAYQRSYLRRAEGVSVIPNAIPPALAARLHANAEEAFARQRVLMLGSLKRYKGVPEFLALAAALPRFSFELVLNETQESIDAFLREEGIELPSNTCIHPRQEDVAPFYNRASLVLNLTRPDLVIETFGLTALEAMTAGLPVIVPPVGGIAEMVEEGENGFHVDSRDSALLKQRVEQVLSNRELYQHLASGARATSERYDARQMAAAIANILDKN